jgi:hypothetical protein
MSRSASIDILFLREIDVRRCIQSLIDSGWRADDEGKMVYLPTGDKDDFNWTSARNESWADVFAIIQDKAGNGELVGIVMTWKDSQVGGEFLFFPEKLHFSLLLSKNRKVLATCNGFSDYSWYLSALLPSFIKAECSIESIICEDFAG